MTLSDGVLGVVLAGGGSRRMGEDKAGLLLGGRSLLERAVETLAGVVDEVVVAGGSLELPIGAGIRRIEDRYPGAGPLAGIDAALAYGAGRDLVVLACDLPLVNAALLRYLLEQSERVGAEAREASAPAAWAMVPEMEGRRQPLCGVYGSSCGEVAELCLHEGSFEVGLFLDRIRARLVPISDDLPFVSPGLFLNVNRPEEYRLARELLTEEER